MNNKINNALNEFIGIKEDTISSDGMEKQVCDSNTGECFIIRQKDGIVERLNKKFITEDGRQLLQD
jgi:hypothetical protein